MSGAPKPELEELFRIRHLSPLLQNISEFDLQEIAEEATLRSHSPRSSLIRQGEPATTLYLLTEGILRHYELTNDGHVAALSIISPGQILGGQAPLLVEKYVISADVIEAAKTLSWPGPVFRSLMERYPTLAINAYAMTYARLGEFVDRFRELATENVERRIAHTLVRLSQQLGRREDDHVVIEAHVSTQDLAGYAGTTLFTVSRVLNRWERLGIIRRQRGTVILEDLRALNALTEAA